MYSECSSEDKMLPESLAISVGGYHETSSLDEALVWSGLSILDRSSIFHHYGEDRFV
jgi:hypothetical protein